MTLNNGGGEWGEHLDHTHTHSEAEVGHQTHLVREKLASSIIHMYMLPSYRWLPSLLE